MKWIHVLCVLVFGVCVSVKRFGFGFIVLTFFPRSNTLIWFNRKSNAIWPNEMLICKQTKRWSTCRLDTCKRYVPCSQFRNLSSIVHGIWLQHMKSIYTNMLTYRWTNIANNLKAAVFSWILKCNRKHSTLCYLHHL